MASVPRPRRAQRDRRRRRARRRRPASSWWRRLRRPLLHLLVAVSCLPVALLLAGGHPALAVLISVGAAAAVALEGRRQRLAHTRDVAQRKHAERVVAAVYEDWISREMFSGTADLDRWRRTHKQ